ncbi:MAG TPA: hypothetical protein VMV23_05340, partial [Candidatus Nanopelagicaceae bacterium]|nr:hypothetical protein [Candidatus Nanopelagicaceae bacterium]
MHSRTPKVLHQVGGVSMLEHSLRAAESATSRPPIVVVRVLDDAAGLALGERAQLVVQSYPGGTAAAL